jgi:hypothetical protein
MNKGCEPSVNNRLYKSETSGVSEAREGHATLAYARALDTNLLIALVVSPD